MTFLADASETQACVLASCPSRVGGFVVEVTESCIARTWVALAGIVGHEDSKWAMKPRFKAYFRTGAAAEILTRLCLDRRSL